MLCIELARQFEALVNAEVAAGQVTPEAALRILELAREMIRSFSKETDRNLIRVIHDGEQAEARMTDVADTLGRTLRDVANRLSRE